MCEAVDIVWSYLCLHERYSLGSTEAGSAEDWCYDVVDEVMIFYNVAGMSANDRNLQSLRVPDVSCDRKMLNSCVVSMRLGSPWCMPFVVSDFHRHRHASCPDMPPPGLHESPRWASPEAAHWHHAATVKLVLGSFRKKRHSLTASLGSSKHLMNMFSNTTNCYLQIYKFIMK